MPLPPYLKSSASSRAHHALLVALDEAPSTQAEDAAIAVEVERCRGVLAGNRSSSRVADTLIILLHCATVTHTPLDLGFALVPALKLAEGGRNMRERRMGYLFLSERLPPGHELHLLLVNTIRKDLASDDDAHILAALHAIAHLPGPDLAPAVLPLLTLRELLEHELPAIRQRTIQAIAALSEGGLALSLRDLARRIRHEDNPSVLAALLRAFSQSLDSGARETDPSRRRRQFDTVFAAVAQNVEPSPLLITAIRTLISIVNTLPRKYDSEQVPDSAPDELQAHVIQQARGCLGAIVDKLTTGTEPWRPGVLFHTPACLFEATALATALFEVDGEVGDATQALVGHLREFLLPPRRKGKEKAGSPSKRRHPAESPNAPVLVRRCFGLLPPSVWQEGLGEEHMAALLGGVDSGDSTVRKETLRLLARADRGLLTPTIESHLGALRTSKGLPLPMQLDGTASRRDALTEGRIEAATRALEVVQVETEGLDDAARGTKLAEGVGRISRALREGGDQTVWLKGVQAVLSAVQAGTDVFRQAFISQTATEVSRDPLDPTATVLLTTAACEYPAATSAAEAIQALVPALPLASASVQELAVLALVPLLAELPISKRAELVPSILSALESAKTGAIKHMAKRCAQVSLIIERGLVDDVVSRTSSRTLDNVLDAVLAVYAEATRPPAKEASPQRRSTHSPRMSASALRYDAYGPPTSGPHSRRDSGQRSGSGSRSRDTKSPLERGAELAAPVRAMGRSMLVDSDANDLALDDLSFRDVLTPTGGSVRLA